MKKLQSCLLGFAGIMLLQTNGIAQVTGPSSSASPYLVPTATGVTFTSVLTTGDSIGTYKMCGTPDGLGAFDNGDSTFTLLMNHEFTNLVGATRTHGSIGAFVSKWVINKSTLAVVRGGDLMQSVALWNTATHSYITYNGAYPSTSAAINRFCSADLAPVSAYFNSKTGKGTTQRIFLNGEEAGNEGRAFGHIATGPNAGKTYELPYLGKFSWENALGSPIESDTTVVIGLDDATPGQVYVYMGSKSTTGTEIERAGLSNGNLYGITVAGMVTEINSVTPTPGTAFTLTNMGNVQAMTGADLNTASNTTGVTTFLRPEDGAWDPSNPNDFYFATTNAFAANSRLWRLRFNNARNPALGGTITAVLDGTEGQKMFDNLTIDNYGHILLVEDVGNNAHMGKLWQYTIATDALMQIGVHDSTRFLTGGSRFLTQDEEASGVLDMETILGPGKFIFVDQAHYATTTELVEGGQLLVGFNPDTYNAAPEINVAGNSVSIIDGDNTPTAADYSYLGDVNLGYSITKSFVINNTGAGSLVISGINFTGLNAGDFSLATVPTFPVTVAAGGNYTITVKLSPTATGTRLATINIVNTDVTEKNYDFAISGGAATPEVDVDANSYKIFDGDITPGTANNTDFGNATLGTSINKDFNVRNTGSGSLNVSGITFGGTNAGNFALVAPPTFPVSIAPFGSMTFTVKFSPSAIGTRNATLYIANDDLDESTYDFSIRGNGVDSIHHNTSVASINTASQTRLYPNPATNEVVYELEMNENSMVAIQVTDIQGKNVLPVISKQLLAGNNSIVINTSDLSNGLYFVKTTDGTSTSTTKLAILK